jgi:glutamine cyclotransferase
VLAAGAAYYHFVVNAPIRLAPARPTPATPTTAPEPAAATPERPLSHAELTADFPDALFRKTRKMKALAASGSATLARAPDLLTLVPARNYAHDPAAFTQGLLVHGGRLVESTGLYGKSELREVSLQTGEVLRRVPIPPAHFGEGLTVIPRSDPAAAPGSAADDEEWFMLTWRESTVHVFDSQWRFKEDRALSIKTDGWGLCVDPRTRSATSAGVGSGAHPRGLLVVSDGTATVRWYDPADMREVKSIAVREWTESLTAPGTGTWSPVPKLNELEWVDGYIWANVWYDHRIAVIEPDSGYVVAWLDMAHVTSIIFAEMKRESAARASDVSSATLNGIAYDAERNVVLLTGKLWHRLYEIPLPIPGLAEATASVKAAIGLV